MSPKGRSFIFLIFCNKLDFQKAQRVPPSTILKTSRFLSLGYGADFRRSRLVQCLQAESPGILILPVETNPTDSTGFPGPDRGRTQSYFTLGSGRVINDWNDKNG